MSALTGEEGRAAVFFDGCAAGRLLLQTCVGCSETQFFPRAWCAACGDDRLEWTEASGDGVLVSYTVVRRSPSAEFAARVPYVVGLVRLPEGPQLMGTIVDANLGELALDMPVRFVASADVAPCFVPG